MKRINKQTRFLILVILLGGFLRFYQLSYFPVHLGHDEVSQLYDAISIARTGRDIYGHQLPFIFQSVNDFKPPFYTYVTVISYFIFGWREITVRIPGALFGTLLIPVVYFFVKKFLKQEGIALTALLLTAISPFEIFYSRKGFENQTGILFMLLGFTLMRSRKKWQVYSGVVLLGVSSYIYFSQAVLVPILLAVFYLIFWKNTRKFFVKSLILFLIMIAPLAYIVYTNPDARNRSKAVFISQDARLGEKLAQKENDFGKLIIFLNYSGQRYLNQFNPKYLFFEGLNMTEGKHDVGPLFAVSAPFLLLGIYLLFRNKKHLKEKIFIASWVLIGFIPSGLTFEDFSPHRAIMAFTMLNVIIAVGVFWFYQKYAKFGFIVLLLLFGLNFIFFIKRYTVNYSIERSEAIHYPYEEVARFAWENHDKYQQIIFDPKFGEFTPWIGQAAHYYLAFYGQYPPEKIQKEFRAGDLLKRETKFDKFSIRAVDWGGDRELKNTLLIASPWSLSKTAFEEGKIIKIFYFKTTTPAFYAFDLP